LSLITKNFATQPSRHRTPEHQWRSRWTKASVLWEIGQRSEAIAEMYAVLEEVEQIRSAYQAKQERQQYFAEQWEVYDTMVNYLLTEGRPDEALEVVERVKTRSLLDLLGSLDYLPESVPADLQGAYRRTMLRLRQRGQEASVRMRQAFDSGPEEVEAAQAEWLTAGAEVNRILVEVRKYAPDYDPLKPIPTIGHASMRSLVQSQGHVFVVWWLGKKVCGAFLLSLQGVQFEPLSRTEELDGILQNYREVLTTTSFAAPQRHLGVNGASTPEFLATSLSQVFLLLLLQITEMHSDFEIK
jgi:pentatricopeptide repeat protein